MKISKIVSQIGIILFFIIALASCEEDFNTIGVDIIGDEINNVESLELPVIAYSRRIDPIETNNLPAYKLGIYNDPVYGKSTADIVSQVLMTVNNPSFGEDGDDAYPVVVDSVYLYIPFFSESTTTDSETTYELDSIYGNDPINISIYESNYFLSDFDPDTNFEEPQKYYSNLGEVFKDENGILTENVGQLLIEINDFVPSNTGYVLNTLDDETLNVAPGIRVALPNDFFKEKIIDKEDTAELLNNNNFKEYFRGLYFDIESETETGNLFIFDFEDAKITIHYGYDKEVTDEDDDDGDGDTTELIIEKQNKVFELAFNGINANMFSSDVFEIDSPDVVNGEERLYLRGGDGFITVIELFGEDSDDNGVADKLEELRLEEEWLINEANLIFYVDQNQVNGGNKEPERILIYDLNKNQVLVDFGFDLTQGETPVNAITQHLGKLERGNDENGDYYKIKITNHINNLLIRDSTNVSLGLVVSQNVVIDGFQDVQNEIDPITSIPSSCIVSPEGTVLHGNLSTNEEKKLKFKIYFTDPN